MADRFDDDRADDGRRIRLGAVLGLCLVLALVGAFAWLATDVPDEPGRVSALQQALRLPAVWVPTEPPPPVVQVAPVAIPASAPATVPDGYMDVCGVGLVKAEEWSGKARVEAMSAAHQATWQRVAAALKARPDERARATGLAMEVYAATLAPDDCEGADCQNVAKMNERAVARLRANVGARNQLALLAMGTRDPAVYGLAYGICRGVGADDAAAACRMLSADQRQRLDPASGLAWLDVAAEAQARGDRARVAEAIHQAGHAGSFDSRMGFFTGVLLQNLPGDVSDLDAHEVALRMLSIEMPRLEGFQAVTQACSAAAVRDTNRLQQCGALADTMATEGGDLLQLTLAHALGKRVGWPAERLDHLQDERDAMMAALNRTAGEDATSLSCASLRRVRTYLLGLAELGEVGAARREIEASGKSVAEWSRDARAQREDKAAQAARAASDVPQAR